jgi:hypothetical protein
LELRGGDAGVADAEVVGVDTMEAADRGIEIFNAIGSRREPFGDAGEDGSEKAIGEGSIVGGRRRGRQVLDFDIQLLHRLGQDRRDILVLHAVGCVAGVEDNEEDAANDYRLATRPAQNG